MKEITDKNHNDIVLTSDVPVLLDFWAPWCGPCRMMKPEINKLAEEMGDNVLVGEINIDENPELAQKYQIQSIPTLKLVVQGDIQKSLIGLRRKDDIRKEMGL